MRNNQEVERRREKDKQAVLEHLKEMPIVTIACKKAGVSHATFYRWRKEDRKFFNQSEEATAQGIAFINDMSESQLITLIKEKKMAAMAMWLKHNHPRYGAKAHIQAGQSFETLSPEQEEIVKRALRLVQPRKARSYEKKKG